MSTSEEFGRYKCFAPKRGTAAYRQGKDQASISLERFHYLRALILEEYWFIDNVGPDVTHLRKQGLDFTPYTDFYLEPILGVWLHPREDGTISHGSLANYHDRIESNYKIADGGILDAVLRDEQAFFNIILSYHSKAKSTGNPEWDTYFADLKAHGFPKEDIDCMFFGRESGCLDGRCPFRHDIKTMQDAREKIFEERRDYMRCPTTDQMNKGTMLHKDAFAKVHNFDKFEDLPDKIKNKFRQPCFRALCAYPECGKAWLITEERSPLRSCGKCDWAYYCSPECQKKDLPRHEKVPCAPIEEIIRNDDLWSPNGTFRKRT